METLYELRSCLLRQVSLEALLGLLRELLGVVLVDKILVLLVQLVRPCRRTGVELFLVVGQLVGRDLVLAQFEVRIEGNRWESVVFWSAKLELFFLGLTDELLGLYDELRVQVFVLLFFSEALNGVGGELLQSNKPTSSLMKQSCDGDTLSTNTLSLRSKFFLCFRFMKILSTLSYHSRFGDVGRGLADFLVVLVVKVGLDGEGDVLDVLKLRLFVFHQEFGDFNDVLVHVVGLVVELLDLALLQTEHQSVEEVLSDLLADPLLLRELCAQRV